MEGLSDMAELQTMMGRVKEESAELQTVDLVEFNKAECYKIRVVAKDKETGEPKTSEQTFLFLDKAKHIPHGVESRENGVATTMYFSEWKEIDGLNLPTKMSGKQGPQEMAITFKKTEFNTLEPKVFELPAEVKKLVGDKGGATGGAAGGSTTRPGH